MMNISGLIRRVEKEWRDHPVSIFRMSTEFAVATPGTPEFADLETTKGAELIGTYRQPTPLTQFWPMLKRDL